MSAKELLSQYFELQDQIYTHFGYEENWRVIPLEDRTDKPWMLIENPDGSGKVVFSDEPFTAESVEAGKTIYGSQIYTQRHLPKWVYRAADCTMVCADTQTDGNKFLMVFDNALECTDDTLKSLYMECWG